VFELITSQNSNLSNISDFNEHLIYSAMSKTFIIRRKDQPDLSYNEPKVLYTIEEQMSKTQQASSHCLSRLDVEEVEVINTMEDDVERMRDENKIVEKLVKTIANMSMD
jgi:hypothetical protein